MREHVVRVEHVEHRVGGGSVQLLGSEDVERAVTGDVVVLAVYYSSLDEILAQRPGQLDGQIVVDITNPVNMETFDSLVVPAGSSAAQQLADRLPSSRVLKAFTTTFAGTLASGKVGPLTTTVLVAGDDTAAILDGRLRCRRLTVRRLLGLSPARSPAARSW